MIILALTFKFYKQIGLCLFLQTLAFVTFNKVCTVQVRLANHHFVITSTTNLAPVQYFIWYFSLLPLAVVRSQLKLAHYLGLFAIWAATQVPKMLKFARKA